MFSLHFLGRGAAFNVTEGNTAACVKNGEELLLLDCGETVFYQLMKQHLLDGVKRLTVAVSHLHSDHCGSLGSLGHYCRYVLGIRMTLLVPREEAYVQELGQLLCIFGNDENSVEMIPAEDWTGMEGIDSLRYVPTEHAEGMQCHSFVMETDEGAVFYSADTCTAATLQDFLKEHQNVFAIYMDTTSADYPGNVHLSLNKLTEALPANLRDRTWLMHVNGPAVIEQGLQLGFRVVSVC